MLNENGPQFESEVSEHLCHHPDIKHIQTIPAQKLGKIGQQKFGRNDFSAHTNEYPSSLDQYLSHFTYALQTATYDSTYKIPVELFLGYKIISPFQRLVNTFHYLKE